MANYYKVLAQSAPSATTNTDIYTVAAGRMVVISTITICNRSTSTATYRIAVRPDGTSILNQHYVVYDFAITSNNTVALTLGITMDASDVLTVYASNANLSFNVFGTEIY